MEKELVQLLNPTDLHDLPQCARQILYLHELESVR